MPGHGRMPDFPLGQRNTEEGVGAELTFWLPPNMTTLWMRGSPATRVCAVGYRGWGGRIQSSLLCYVRPLQQYVLATLRGQETLDQIWDGSLHWPGLNFNNWKWQEVMESVWGILKEAKREGHNFTEHSWEPCLERFKLRHVYSISIWNLLVNWYRCFHCVFIYGPSPLIRL